MAQPVIPLTPFGGDVLVYPSWRSDVVKIKETYTTGERPRVGAVEFALSVRRSLTGAAGHWMASVTDVDKYNVDEVLRVMDLKYGPAEAAKDIMTRLSQQRPRDSSKESMEEAVEELNRQIGRAHV